MYTELCLLSRFYLNKNGMTKCIMRKLKLFTYIKLIQTQIKFNAACE